MCSPNDSTGAPLSFAQLVELLQEPPFEPCESELDFLTPAEYENTFNEVMRQYFKRITYYIGRIIDNHGAAPDLAQELFFNLYRARTSFEPSYIYRAAKNTAYSELRRQGRERRVLIAHWKNIKLGREEKSEELDTPDPQPLQDEVLIARAIEDAVRRAVDRLPEKFRVPLGLLAEGKSYKQIIEITQVNEGTVKSRICRGKVILRRRLRAYL